MVIAKTVNRNIAFKAAGAMSKAVLDAQSSCVTPEVTGLEASSDLQLPGDDDVERNADLLYIFNHEAWSHWVWVLMLINVSMHFKNYVAAWLLVEC